MTSLRTQIVSGRKALLELERRLEIHAQTGLYPFLMGNPSRSYLHDGADLADSEETEAILGVARSFDCAAWFRCQREMEFQELEDWEAATLLGEWQAPQPQAGLALLMDFRSGESLSEVLIGTIEIEESWQLPAYLKFGDWNACPAPEVHCATHRKWQSEFGSQIVGVSHSVLECEVLCPPEDQDEALELAWEQYFYCSDLVHQGFETIHGLASHLLEASYWSFWWD